MARETGPYHQVRMCVSLVQWQLADWFPIRLTLTGVHSSVLHSFFGQGFDSACCPTFTSLAASCVNSFAARAFGDGWSQSESEVL